MESTRPPTDELLAQLGWIRALARSMVADLHLAEDLAQETCFVALRHPPRSAEGLRGFLKTVMRNALGQRLRRESQRQARESFAAPPEAQTATDRLVERAQVQRALVDHVLELPSIYREVLLLRFFEELPPREIAKRLDVPVHTIKTRLSRALARMRETLERSHDGDRSQWLGVLLLIAPPRHLPPLFGVLAVKTQVSIAVGLAVAIGGVLLIKPQTSQQAAPLQALVEPPVEELQDDIVSVAPDGDVHVVPPPSRNTVDSVRETAIQESVADTSGTLWRVTGQVVDDLGRPLGGVAVYDEAGGASTTSAANGEFALETTANRGSLAVLEARWVTVSQGLYRRDSDLPPTIIVAPSIDITGIVRDEFGRPLSNVFVRMNEPRDFATRFSHRPDGTLALGRSTQSERDGSFDFTTFPAVRGASLYFQLAGYTPASAPLPASGERVEVVLASPDQPLEGSITGRVITPEGQPVPEARVAMGIDSVVTAEDGAFVIDLGRAVTADRIRAVKPGFLPGEIERPIGTSADDPNGGWPEFLEIRLGGPPLQISGHVIDEEGKPIAGAHVWIDNPTPFGVDGFSPLGTEALLAGGKVPIEPLRKSNDRPATDSNANSWGPWWSPEEPTGLWWWTATDAQGAFTLEGLLPRDYRLKVLDPESLNHITSGLTAAGTQGIRIELERSTTRRRISGVIVGPNAEPIPSASVRLFTRTRSGEHRVFGGVVHNVYWRSQPAIKTDALGRFELENVPSEGMELDISGEHIVPQMTEIPPGRIADDLVIQVETRLHIKLSLAKHRATAALVECRDKEDARIPMWRIQGGSRDSRSHFPIIDGRSPVLTISSRGHSLVLWDSNGVELERLSLAGLRSGEVNLIER